MRPSFSSVLRWHEGTSAVTHTSCLPDHLCSTPLDISQYFTSFQYWGAQTAHSVQGDVKSVQCREGQSLPSSRKYSSNLSVSIVDSYAFIWIRSYKLEIKLHDNYSQEFHWSAVASVWMLVILQLISESYFGTNLVVKPHVLKTNLCQVRESGFWSESPWHCPFPYLQNLIF